MIVMHFVAQNIEYVLSALENNVYYTLIVWSVHIFNTLYASFWIVPIDFFLQVP